MRQKRAQAPTKRSKRRKTRLAVAAMAASSTVLTAILSTFPFWHFSIFRRTDGSAGLRPPLKASPTATGLRQNFGRKFSAEKFFSPKKFPAKNCSPQIFSAKTEFTEIFFVEHFSATFVSAISFLPIFFCYRAKLRPDAFVAKLPPAFCGNSSADIL